MTSSCVDVVLLGAPGSGKSTLARALVGEPLVAAHAAALAHGAYEVGGTRVTVLDPPGSPELAGELHAGLRAASAVLLVLSPVQGLDPRTVALWGSLEHLPRVVVLSQLDRPGADADEAVALCQRLLGDGVHAVQLPLHDDDGSVGGLLDLLELTVSHAGEQRPADPEHVTLVEGLRGDLVEAVLTGSEDEARFTAYLADDEPEPAELAAELAAAVGRGDVQPVLVAVPRRGVGLPELAALLAGLPPAAEQVAPAASGPDGSPLDGSHVVAEVVAPGLLRVWSGTLHPGDEVLAGGRAAVWDGPVALAGDVARTGLPLRPRDVVSTAPARLAPWPASAASFPVGAPEDDGLDERVAADPVARLEPDGRTGQLLLWTYGPEHAEALLDGLPSAPVRLPPGARPVGVRGEVPAWAARAVRSDLAARGGELLTSAEDGDQVVLEARLPAAEAVGYALALGRVSAHTAVLTRR